MPVMHRVDFVNSHEVFEVRGVKEEEEALVEYAPAFLFGGLKPKLHFYIYPKGHFDEFYYPDSSPGDAQARPKPIAEWHPKASASKNAS